MSKTIVILQPRRCVPGKMHWCARNAELLAFLVAEALGLDGVEAHGAYVVDYPEVSHYRIAVKLEGKHAIDIDENEKFINDCIIHFGWIVSAERFDDESITKAFEKPETKAGERATWIGCSRFYISDTEPEMSKVEADLDSFIDTLKKVEAMAQDAEDVSGPESMREFCEPDFEPASHPVRRSSFDMSKLAEITAEAHSDKTNSGHSLMTLKD